MGMTIDEALETIKGERWISCQEKYLEAMNLITETMRKYQKIREILNNNTYYEDYGNNAEKFIVSAISEVIKDGNE